jgi:hypothetical protein
MKDEKGSVRTVYLRPMVLAALFIVAGQVWISLQWGTEREPGGDMGAGWLWNLAVTMVTVFAIGLMTGFIVGMRYDGFVAGVIAACCYVTVLTATILICFDFDMALGLFGAAQDPKLVIGVSLALVLGTAPLFGWLLYGRWGMSLMSRIGL